MPAIKWRTRPFHSGDESGVLELHQRIYQYSISMEHYRWKTMGSPIATGEPAAFVAEHNGQIIGHYAGTATRFKVGESILPFNHGCYAMTGPQFRGQGVLTSLATAAAEAWTKAGIAGIYGLPTAAWGNRREYLGFRRLFALHWLHRPLRYDSLALGRLGGSVPGLAGLSRIWNHLWDARLDKDSSSLSIKRVKAADDSFDHIWESCHPHYSSLLVRNRTWLQYRYFDAPDFDYTILQALRDQEPVGYLAYRTSRSENMLTGWVADLFTRPEDRSAQAALLREATRDCAQRGVGQMIVQVSNHAPLAALFRQAGFFRRGKDFELFVAPLAQTTPLKRHQDPSSLFTIGGDYDLV